MITSCRNHLVDLLLRDYNSILIVLEMNNFTKSFFEDKHVIVYISLTSHALKE